MIEKEFEGKPWDIAVESHRYLLESLSVEKEYKIIVKIEEI